MKIILFVFTILVLQRVHSAKLPSYIIPCQRSSPELDKCVVEHGRNALPRLVQGDKKYNIPNLSPLELPGLTIDASRNLKVTMKDVQISGLENSQIKDANIDLENRHLKFIVFIPRANLLSDYNINGRILILPIRGQGPANITLVDGTFTCDIDYELQQKKGEDYITITNTEIKYDAKRIYFYLANLFGGDSRLGEEMNKFLNENWKEVAKDIGPALTETISQIITSILQAIMKKVPYNEFFLP